MRMLAFLLGTCLFVASGAFFWFDKAFGTGAFVAAGCLSLIFAFLVHKHVNNET